MQPSALTISGISPLSGPAAGGVPVTITGTGFGTLPGTVFVGGVPASVVSWSDAIAVVMTPAGTPGPAAVSVQVGAEFSAAFFTFIDDAP